MSRHTIGQVYWLADGEPHVHGVVRYDGDPDVFTALIHAWAIKELPALLDAPAAICPPEPRLYRWVPGGEYGQWLDTAARPGHGVWTGALIKTVRIGCTECQRLHGQHSERCINGGITSLVTLQFDGDRKVLGVFGTPQIVHAVRRRPAQGLQPASCPGPTLCGIERFTPGAPPWIIGGGRLVPDMRGCYQCGKVARDEFPDLEIYGTLPIAEVFASDSRVPLAPHLADEKLRQLIGSRPEGTSR